MWGRFSAWSKTTDRAVDDLGRDLVATVGRQAVHEDRVRGGVAYLPSD
ncbi:MAG: hypothetical protein R3A46_19515 [Thermomicrobiales bacterium]